jgi:hypothetical protein
MVLGRHSVLGIFATFVCHFEATAGFHPTLTQSSGKQQLANNIWQTTSGKQQPHRAASASADPTVSRFSCVDSFIITFIYWWLTPVKSVASFFL